MTRPSLADYGTHDESAFPELWEGAVGAWAPCLGPTGLRLHDFSMRQNWGTLTNMDAATDWVVDGGQYGLDFDNANDFINLPSLTLNQSRPVSIRWFEKVASTAGTFQSRFILKTTGTRGLVVFRSTATGYLSLAVNGKNTGDYARFVTAPTIAASVGVWREWVLVNTATVGSSGAPWRLWVDGIEHAAILDGAAGNFGNANCRIGLDGLGDDPANCAMDDITIWDRSLTEAEVLQLRQLGRGGMYQRRRRTTRYFTTGPTFQAAWARGSNVILQPCGVA